MPPSRPDFDERPIPPLKRQIIAGGVVTLKLGGVSVLVHRVVPVGARRYRGTIVGFEKWLAPTCGGYAVGDKVEFSERQVFVCAMP